MCPESPWNASCGAADNVGCLCVTAIEGFSTAFRLYSSLPPHGVRSHHPAAGIARVICCRHRPGTRFVGLDDRVGVVDARVIGPTSSQG